MQPLLERLLDHNRHATRAVLETCRSLSAEQFHQRFDIGPGSLHDTLRHIIGAMIRWSDRIMQRDVRPSIEQDPRRLSVDELLELLARGDRELREAAAASEPRLEEKITVTFTPQMAPLHITRATALVHIATHGAHHRAQCLNMLRRLGVIDLPHVDALASELKP
jgi:uncharacterized damage-inducible protein DinB